MKTNTNSPNPNLPENFGSWRPQNRQEALHAARVLAIGALGATALVGGTVAAVGMARESSAVHQTTVAEMLPHPEKYDSSQRSTVGDVSFQGIVMSAIKSTESNASVLYNPGNPTTKYSGGYQGSASERPIVVLQVVDPAQSGPSAMPLFVTEAFDDKTDLPKAGHLVEITGELQESGKAFAEQTAQPYFVDARTVTSVE